jgi:hypothetical protein
MLCRQATDPAQMIKVEELALDRANYRTMLEKLDASALRAMISADGPVFWALMEGLRSE